MFGPPPGLWLAQASSDYRAAGILQRNSGEGLHLRCQVISKNQQAVEKSVKALATLLEEARFIRFPQRQLYSHKVDRLLEAMEVALPTTKSAVFREACRILQVKHAISALCSLAPSAPATGDVHARNTEYPYETAPGAWVIPAGESSFSERDVRESHFLATTAITRATRAVNALRVQF